jgi:Spy/CpxP family protein refolding chaperone
MKRVLVLVVGLILSASAVAVLAQGRGGRMGGPMGGPGGPGSFLPMLHQLNLSDAQKQQVKALMDDYRPADVPQIPQLEHKLHVAVLSGDQGSIETLKAQLNDAHAQELNQRVEMLQKLAQILTPEQKEQLIQMQPHHPGR